jgi:hypothetical protein
MALITKGKLLIQHFVKSVDGKTTGKHFDILKLYRSCKETAFSKKLM